MTSSAAIGAGQRGRFVLPLLLAVGFLLFGVGPARAADQAPSWRTFGGTGRTDMLHGHDVCTACVHTRPARDVPKYRLRVELRYLGARPDHVRLLLVRGGIPYAKVDGCEYRGSRAVAAGDRVLAYARGRELKDAIVPPSLEVVISLTERSAVTPVASACDEGPVAAARPFRVWHSWVEPTSGERFLLDQYEARSSVAVPAGLRTVLRPMDDLPTWPRTVVLTPESPAPAFHREAVRSVRLTVTGGVAREVFAVHDARASNWSADRLDALVHWSFVRPPNVRRAPHAVEIDDLLHVPYHVLVRSELGGLAYHYLDSACDASSLDLSVPTDAMVSPPPVGTLAIDPGSVLVPGSWDLVALEALSASGFAPLRVPAAGERLILPSAETLTAWDRGLGIVRVRRTTSGWRGQAEPGAIRVVVHRAALLPATVRLVPLVPGTGALRFSGDAGFPVRLSTRETCLRGLPLGRYRVEFLPDAGKRTAWSTVELSERSPRGLAAFGRLR